MATHYRDLIPLQIANDVIEAARAESVAPSAAFVGVGERKPVTQIEWTASRLEPEEIAAIVW